MVDIGKKLVEGLNRMDQQNRPVTDLYANLPDIPDTPKKKWRDNLDDQEKAEVQLCINYAATHRPGAISFYQTMLIAKLAELLDKTDGT